MPGLFDTIRGFARKVGAGVSRGIGALAHGIRRVGDVTKPIAMGAARFVGTYHQPLSLALKAAGDLSGNQTMQNVGNAAMLGSAALTARGIGRDYGLRPHGS
jgi:hypothetical protein